MTVARFASSHLAVVVPIYNINTDTILPSQFMITTKRSGLAAGLFFNWRDTNQDPRNRNFFLNNPELAKADTLIVGKNFGCGSSREHAVWALTESGIQTVIGMDFNDTFMNNAAKNGLITISLKQADLTQLLLHPANTCVKLQVDLKEGTIGLPTGEVMKFALTRFQKHAIFNGVSDIEIAINLENKIHNHWKTRCRGQPWL